MEIKEGNYVKTYSLSTGEIEIGQIYHIINKDKVIQSWQGTNSLTYKNGKDITFEKNTIIWDKKETRWVFYYGKPYNACFSTIVVDASEYLECLLVDNEKVIYRFR